MNIKKLLLFFLFILVAVLSVQISKLVFADDHNTEMKFIIYGEPVDSDVMPQKRSGAYMVPARATFEKLGASSVIWNADKREMTIEYKGMIIKFAQNGRYSYINEKRSFISPKPYLQGERLMVPLNFFHSQLHIESGVIENEGIIFIGNDEKTSDNSSGINQDLDRVPENSRGTSGSEKASNPGVVTKLTQVFKNGRYSSEYDRVFLVLGTAKLVEGEKQEINNYSAYYETDTKFVISFDSFRADLEEAQAPIDDYIMKSISVVKGSGNTKIIFESYEKLNYTVTTRDYDDGTYETAVTILKQPDKSQKLVVIDPGHGGRDGGAWYGGLNEKEFNIKIALRLEKLLNENGVKTYMTRQDDTYVGVFERAFIANALKADLFLSIHNNASTSKSKKGTETLYFSPTDTAGIFNGKSFATIINKNLINNINTTNNGIISRPDLIVLKHTSMPAVISETYYMSNSEDLQKLIDDSVLDNIAYGLYKGILEALEKV